MDGYERFEAALDPATSATPVLFYGPYGEREARARLSSGVARLALPATCGRAGIRPLPTGVEPKTAAPPHR
jgi:hypothetical protein